MRNWLEKNPSTLVLARGELVSARPGAASFRIFCIAGRLWVTAPESREDVVLLPGQGGTFTGRGRVVVQALRTATVRLELGAPTRVEGQAAFPLRPVPSARLPLPST